MNHCLKHVRPLPSNPFRKTKVTATGVQDRQRFVKRDEIDAVIAKNSGGSAAAGKLAAARTLGLPVYMFARPALPPAPSVADVPAALTWIDHWRASGTARAE